MTGKDSQLFGRVCPTVLGACLLLSSPAWAEVSDKEPGTYQIWLVAAGFCAIALVAAMVRPWLALLLLPVSSLLVLALIDELHDPAVGPAIMRELGDAYLWQTYLAAALAWIGPVVAWATLRAIKGHQKP